jgi:uncharacterized protein (TIGR03435 family)
VEVTQALNKIVKLMNETLKLALTGAVLAQSLVQPRAAMAQTDGTISHFEVLSLGLNNQGTDFGPYFGKCIGEPGKQSPTFWICNRTHIIFLIGSALAVEVYQLPPLPNRMAHTFLSVSARLPQGATKEQFREMQRNLQIERFDLTWHWKESDAIVYRLVRAPRGVKLREAAPDADPAVVTTRVTLEAADGLKKERS